MLTTALVLLGVALLVLALADRLVRRLPLSPALLYLLLGWAAGVLLEGPSPAQAIAHAGALRWLVEFALLASLLAIGLRLRVGPTLRGWRVALLLAGPGMVVTIALTAVLAVWLLSLPWAAALVLAAVLAPTDPVLASEVQIRSEQDRDAVRLSLTAEGGLNDATAWPVVALGLGLLGLHALGDNGGRWLTLDLLWPLGGGALLGIGLGLLLGHVLRRRVAAGDPVARDELLHMGALALSFGVAHALGVSTFLVAFALGTTLLLPMAGHGLEHAERALADRLQDFGARFERLVEATTVLAVGVMLAGLQLYWREAVFALLLAAVARPLAVLVVVRASTMPVAQRRLVAWFGIRGLGSLFYLLWVLEKGVDGALADQLSRVTLVCIAVSIVLHGISATPVMAAYQRRRERTTAR